MGLLIAVEFSMVFFAIINFVVPTLELLGPYGEFLSLLSGLPLLALGAWRNFELTKFLGKLSVATHLKVVAMTAILLMIVSHFYKPILQSESNE